MKQRNPRSFSKSGEERWKGIYLIIHEINKK
ncbi:MAG: hypothetical protein ACI90V_003433 [Bacillariaceae sp.]|jgi:hypothetical protein